MPSVRYFNQTAPFWDFVASMEDQGASHPFFGRNNSNRDEAAENDNERPNPWTEGWAGFPWGPVPHRGGRHGPHPPPQHEGPAPTQAGEAESDPEGGPSDEAQQEPGSRFGRREHPHHPHHHHHPHGSHRGRPGMGGRGGHWGRGRGRGLFHPYAAGPFGGFAEMFQNQFCSPDNVSGSRGSDEFTPEVDVFDTSEAFVVHVSLPGAKKEDLSVGWDAEKSELAIAGVVHRPGDEELLKTLALDERKVGAFDRKVRLGSRANPAQVDVDAIAARMEDGVLRVEVPKLDAGYVEIKKVDVE